MLRFSRFPHTFELLFGILLNLGLAGLALQLQQIPLFQVISPLIIAIAIGMTLRNTIGIAPFFYPGTRFCLKRLLKLAIVLMGLRLSLTELQQIGLSGLLLVAITLTSTFGFTLWLGYLFNIKQRLVWLVAAGTAICGASAVVATNSVIDGSDEDMVYAVSLVTVFGTVAMLLYPILATVLQLSPEVFGLWCGTSIHEVAQVVAAAFQNSNVSGEFATIIKLSRVLFLIPVMLVLGGLSMGLGATEHYSRWQRLPIPWFILLFMGLVLLNSTSLVAESLRSFTLQLNQLFLATALVAMGLETDLSKLRQIGLKPIYLAALSWLFLATLSLGLIQVLYRFHTF